NRWRAPDRERRYSRMIAEHRQIAALVLAAGESRRLGRPKQLAQFRGQPLLRHVAQTALQSHCDRVIVTLGANAGECRRVLETLPLETLMVEDWREGMSASIVAGATLAISRTEISALLVTLCDQPLVTAAMLNRILAEYKNTGAPIVASEYAGVLGAPVLFARNVFADLMSLRGDRGARDLLTSQRHPITCVSLPEAVCDIDTTADLERLQIDDVPTTSQ
ncbi:MAG TPA: nucleotidyltransferase family protein, partial [candidate division Zixibacteria bacterium]|nr:nucleotidyltransferase family protein [candidate division Zixibacteria bacterium]